VGPLLLSGCAGGPRAPQPVSSGVVYYRDPADPSVAVAVGWDGRTRGRLRLPAGVADWQQSPDGAYLLAFDGGGGMATVMSPEGRVVLRVASDATWADDSRHVCVTADVNGDYPEGS